MTRQISLKIPLKTYFSIYISKQYMIVKRIKTYAIFIAVTLAFKLIHLTRTKMAFRCAAVCALALVAILQVS